jgi:hypothetical protein
MGEASAAVKHLAEAGEESSRRLLRGLWMIPSGDRRRNAVVGEGHPSLTSGRRSSRGHSQRSRPFPFARRRLAQHAIGTKGLLLRRPCFPRAGPPAPRMNWQHVSTHRGASQHYRGSPHVNATAKTKAGEFGRLSPPIGLADNTDIFPSRLGGRDKQRVSVRIGTRHDWGGDAVRHGELGIRS